MAIWLERMVRTAMTCPNRRATETQLTHRPLLQRIQINTSAAIGIQ